MQRLIVKNFGPLKDIDLEIKDLQIFIGPQASGKSTIAKLVYFFKSIKDWSRDILMEYQPPTILGTEKKQEKDFVFFTNSLQHKLLTIFETLFSYKFVEDQQNGLLEFVYSESKRLKIQIFNGQPQLILDFPKNSFTKLVDIQSKYELLLKDSSKEEFQSHFRNYFYESLLEVHEVFEEQFYKSCTFVPSNRTLLSTGYIYKPLTTGMSGLRDSYRKYFPGLIESFSQEADSLRKRCTRSLKHFIEKNTSLTNGNHLLHIGQKTIQVIQEGILKAEYKYTESPLGGEDRLYSIGISDNNWSVSLENSSSGQQEVLWLLLSLLDKIICGLNCMVFIDEPEAHLYPESQKHLVDLFGLYLNSHQGNQLTITTHSPYILTAFNNLLYAHQVGKKKEKEVKKVIPKEMWIDPKRVGAYFVDGGKIRDILDSETEMIKAEEIDSASSVIYETYEQLSNLKWDE